MQLHPVDIAIIVGYIVAMILIGVILSKRAAKNLDSYFLGGKIIPWYYLGVANASGMFDITGTMWLVTLMFIYGLKSAWIPWLWPMFNQVFLMIYLAAWLRRSNVMTGAEWIKTRFGRGMGSELSHISVVIYALISVVGFLAYDFQGIGKFAKVFLPWDVSPHVYAIAFMGVTTVYTILGGMFSVVITDLIQFTLMTITSVFIAVIAITRTSPEAIAAVVPHGWKELFFGWKLNLDWSNLIAEVNNKIAADGYSLFTIFFFMILFKGFLVSMAGPAPNYDMQKILSTRSPKEASKMSFSVNLALFFPRYLMIAGIGVLGLVFYSSQLNAMGANVDFEQILPFVLNNFIPVGVMGIVVAGLLAAFMSTFSCTVNCGASYVVNDIYKRYINSSASDKKYVAMSYICTILVVIAGIAFGFKAQSIDTVTKWIVAALWGGYMAPNVLKWYWWRLNGFGYFLGMVTGIACAMILPVALPKLSALNGFPIILVVSTAASIITSLMTPPESDETLKNFYIRVRPWGFWKPVYEKVIRDNPHFERNMNFYRDMTNVCVGIIWQLMLMVVPIYLVIREFRAMWVAAAVLVITSIILKYNWYDKLEEYKKIDTPEPARAESAGL